MNQDILNTAGGDGATLGIPFPLTRPKRRRRLWPRAVIVQRFKLPNGEVAEVTVAIMAIRDWNAMDRGFGWSVYERKPFVIATKLVV